MPCAHAEAVYRATPRPPRVDAAQARDHLAWLGERGIGVTQASRLSGVARSTLQDIRNGTRVQIAAALAAQVLAIDGVPAPGALVKAWPLRRLLAWFRLEGFTDAEVARRLGYRSLQLRFSSHCCRVRNAARVRALHRKVAQI